MSRLSFDRYRSEIPAQARPLAASLAGVDLTVAVPSCPDWTVGQLVRHLGGALTWAETIVRTRATEPPVDDFHDVSRFTDHDPAVLGPWLVETAERLADTLGAAGPDLPVFTPIPGEGTPFFARRMTHETAIHRADADLALGVDYTLDQDVALDAVDEWMELGSLPMHFEVHPRTRELLGPGRTLSFHATDTGPDAGADWLVDLTGDALAWRPATEPGAVEVRGRLVDLLLVIYKRIGPDAPGVEIRGDAALLDFWLDRVSFG